MEYTGERLYFVRDIRDGDRRRIHCAHFVADKNRKMIKDRSGRSHRTANAADLDDCTIVD